jgi:hypothetical protein
VVTHPRTNPGRRDLTSVNEPLSAAGRRTQYFRKRVRFVNRVQALILRRLSVPRGPNADVGMDLELVMKWDLVLHKLRLRFKLVFEILNKVRLGIWAGASGCGWCLGWRRS